MRLFGFRRGSDDQASAGDAKLPDPALPPGNRGPWEEAALTNVDITEMVKHQLRTETRPWNK